jgi:hypothetical protein
VSVLHTPKGAGALLEPCVSLIHAASVTSTLHLRQTTSRRPGSPAVLPQTRATTLGDTPLIKCIAAIRLTEIQTEARQCGRDGDSRSPPLRQKYCRAGGAAHRRCYG